MILTNITKNRKLVPQRLCCFELFFVVFLNPYEFAQEEQQMAVEEGFIMFLNNYSAIEVNVGVLGFGYTHTRAVTNQVQVSKRDTKHANFKINLFSVQFGMAFYI